MKFLHAADIHLDSPLTGLSRRDDLPPDLVCNCTRRAFAAMVDLAREQDVAFVIIAGDLYDGDWKDFSTGLFFAEQMYRLGRPCYLLRGNHDARSHITKHLTLPDNVHEFSSRTCETFALPELGVALHGHSFPNRAVPEDLSAGYPEPLPGLLNIGVLHTSAADPGDHETYAPCDPAGLVLKGYDYWALGHIHARRVLCERPWVVYPGNLQGRTPKETGAKGCTLVTVQDGAIAAVEHQNVDVLRWAALQVDATGADAAMLTSRLTAEVQDAVGQADGRPLLARVTLTGGTSLYARLANDIEALTAECRNAAIAAGGSLWVESVRLRTRPVAADGADRLDAVHVAFAAGLDDSAQIHTLLEELAELRQRVPAPARADLDLPEDEEGLRALASDAWQIVADACVALEDQP